MCIKCNSKEYRSNPDVIFWPSHKILVKVLSNIVENPKEAKFRRLNKKGKAFAEMAGEAKGCESFLKTIGWKDEGDFLVLPPGETEDEEGLTLALAHVLE